MTGSAADRSHWPLHTKELTASAYVAAGHLLGRGIPLLVGILVARVFGVEAFAAISFFILTVSTFAVYAGLGVSLAAAKTFAARGSDPQRTAPEILALWMLAVVGAGGASIVLLFLGDGLTAEVELIETWALVAAVVAACLGIVPSGAVQGCERFRSGFFAAAWSAVVCLAATLFATTQERFPMVIFGLILASLVRAALEFWATRRAHAIYAGNATLEALMGASGRVLRTALPAAMTGLIASSGIWFLGWIQLKVHGPATFALFAAGMHWFALGMLSSMVLARVVFASQVRAFAQAGHSGGQTVISRVVSRSLVACALSCALLAIGYMLQEQLIALYGIAFRNHPGIIPAFLLAALIAAPATFIGNALVAGNKAYLWTAVYAGWFAVLACLSFAKPALLQSGGATILSIANLWLVSAGALLLRSLRNSGAKDESISPSIAQNSTNE